jgi:hypothetical protein
MELSAMDGALTLATFAGFALGPEGLILSAGATILQQVLHSLSDGKQTLPESEIVASVLRDELTENGIQTALASFQTTYSWFQEYYIDKWADDTQSNTQAELDEFRANLSGALGPNSMFLTFLNLLQERSYISVGFSAFMLGAALHIVLLKIDLILKSTDRRVVDTPAINPLIDCLGRYADRANSAMTTIDSLIRDRLKQIGEVAEENGKYAFVDTGDVGQNPNGVRYEYNKEADAKVGRDLVVTRVTAREYLQYYGGRRDKALASITEWRDAQNKYQKLLKDSTT